MTERQRFGGMCCLSLQSRITFPWKLRRRVPQIIDTYLNTTLLPISEVSSLRVDNSIVPSDLGAAHLNSYWFLGAFENLRKANISFVVSVCLSVCPYVCSHGAYQLPLDFFHEIWYLRIFRKSVKKHQVSLKSGKNKRHFTWTPVYVYDIISLNCS